MASSLPLLLLFLLPLTLSQSISVLVTNPGLDFAKDLLIHQALISLTPLRLPDIEKSVHVPFVGGVEVVASNITLRNVNVSASVIRVGEAGVFIQASGATAVITLDWRYSYSTWLVPIEVEDSGTAHVQVKGMEVGLTMSMKNNDGSLKLTTLECGCYMEDVLITLDGGASWFYQGFVDAFEDQIRAVVEKTITKKIAGGISKLDSLLQSIPKTIKIDDVASMNVTFMDDPILSNTSVEFDIDGLFIPTNGALVPTFFHKSQQNMISCGEPSRMLGILLDETVINSASLLYFNAGRMHLSVDKVPEQSLLNTAGWKYVIPQLYKQYPNDDMKLNISLTSAPMVIVTSDDIGSTIYSDMVVDVLHRGETVPVACISVTVTASGVMEISGNNLAGRAELKDFSLSLKWSKVGNFHMFLIERVMRIFLDTIFMPYVNLHLHNGIPLPMIHGFTVQDATISSSNNAILVCADAAYTSPSAPDCTPYNVDAWKHRWDLHSATR